MSACGFPRGGFSDVRCGTAENPLLASISHCDPTRTGEFVRLVSIARTRTDIRPKLPPHRGGALPGRPGLDVSINPNLTRQKQRQEFAYCVRCKLIADTRIGSTVRATRLAQLRAVLDRVGKLSAADYRSRVSGQHNYYYHRDDLSDRHRLVPFPDLVGEISHGSLSVGLGSLVFISCSELVNGLIACLTQSLNLSTRPRFVRASALRAWSEFPDVSVSVRKTIHDQCNVCENG